ncbi:DUF317 domain-containing protein [Streptomyces uncialis]|uniref:DUF317 domain-containing protein n=1 Tax=Streptomyces uncialis TaxID=1048205 RepID=UPI002E2F183C|nr:DUF317 domain-containing protein [Streptomyces uncialis]
MCTSRLRTSESGSATCPRAGDDALWKIAAYREQFARPHWAAAFNTACPTEYVTAFTTGLVASYDPHGDAFLRGGLGNYRDPTPVLAPMLEADWIIDDRRTMLKLTSPDGLAGAWYDRRDLDPDNELVSNETRWGMWGGPPRVGWYAVFSHHTPTALITATAAAVVDPAPVLRWHGELTRSVRQHAQATPVRPPAPTPGDTARTHWRPAPTLGTVSAPPAGPPPPPAPASRPRPARLAAADPALPFDSTRNPMSLHAEQFFTEALPLRIQGSVVGNSFYAVPPPGSQIRLRIDFYETIYHQKFGGLRLTVLHPDQGKIDVVALSFKEYGTFRARATSASYDRHVINAGSGRSEPPWKGGDFTALAQAVHAYAGMWGYPAPKPTVRSSQRAALPVPAPSRVRGR